MPLRQLVQPKLKKPLTQEISSGFGLVATGELKPGQVQVPEDVTFYAPLVINPQDYASQVQHTVTRDSAAVRNRSGVLHLVNANAPRHESAGLLMEPASTNKCVNFNANPDEALTGWGFTGAPALFYRVNDSSELRAAGLHNICTSGFVLCLDNTAGTGSASIRQSTGITGNTNTHSMYAYCRKDAASAANGQIKVSGGVAQQFSNTSYERIEIPGFTPPDNNTWFELVALAGAKVYMVLNQLEEQSVPTSVIVTEGAAGVRAVDGLQWRLAGKPFGSELIQNGDFNNGITGWTAGNGAVLSIEDGRLRVENGAADFGHAEQSIDVTGVDWVRLTGDYFRGDVAGIFRVSSTPGAGNLLNEGVGSDMSVDFIVNVNAFSTVYISVWNNGNSVGQYNHFDNISVTSASSILNQSEGMAAILWRPGFSDSDLATGVVQTGRLLNTLGPRFLFPQKTIANANNFVLDDGVTTAVITVTGGWVANRDYLVTARWSGANKHIRFKAVGAWETEVSAAYSGSFPEDGVLRLYDLADAPQMQKPAHCRDVYLWSEDKGAAWLESFFSGVAN